MIAYLYILPESFAYNPQLSKEAIENKINALAADFNTFKQYPAENVCYINSTVYDVKFVSDITLLDLLYNDEIAKGKLDRDARNSLQKVIVESAKETEVPSATVIKDYLPSHSADHCYGVICFNELEDVQTEYQVIYNEAGWYKFRRTFLGIYPGEAGYFMDECCKYFPKLFFHENNWSVIGAILNGNSRKIVYHLTALNDSFKTYSDSGKRRDLVLHDFSIGCNLDATATLEGDPDRKIAFTFEFLVDGASGIKEKVVCEPHLKLCYTDDSPNQNYSNERRIYFHEGKDYIHKGKVLVGHIGRHL